MLWEFNNLLTPKYIFSEKIFSARTVKASPSNLSDAHLSDDELTPQKKVITAYREKRMCKTPLIFFSEKHRMTTAKPGFELGCVSSFIICLSAAA